MEYHPATRAATRYIATLIALASLPLFARPAVGSDPPLTLAEAQRIAVARSRALVAQDAAVNGPDAFSLTRDFMTMTSVGVMQEFTREEKREARAERYRREADKALADKTAGIAAIRRDTALAWLDRHYAEAMLGVAAEQSRQAQTEIEAAESAYRSGRGNLADVLGARAALVSLEDRASELGRRAATARIALARWVGSAADAPLAGAPAIDAIGLDSRTLDADLEHHPQLAVLAKQEAVAAAELRSAEANRKPDWSLAVMYSQRGAAYSNLISVNVSVPLQWDRKNRQDREIAAKLALLDQARAEREDLQRAHAAEVRAMIAEWENDLERSARYERELLPLAGERTQATLAAYRGAKASLVDVLMSRRNEIDIRLQALQLQMDTARLWAQLNFLEPEGTAEPSAAMHTKDPQ